MNDSRENKFCRRSSLRNESDVEQFFLISLLKDLGYGDINIFTKKSFSLPVQTIGKGKNKRDYQPDYALKINNNWVLVIEAKHPQEEIKKYVSETQEYSASINRNYVGHNPIRYCVVSNGICTEVYPVDENKPLVSLKFEDFRDENVRFQELRQIISFSSLKSFTVAQRDIFEFRKVPIDELRATFQSCHNLIRNKQSLGPKKAFYEFTKLLFVKLNEDKKLKIKQSKRDLKKRDFRFSLFYIKNQADQNPINNLFKEYRDKLERQVIRGEKKRIFPTNEQIGLNPSTIREVIGMLQEMDLYSIEEDINGKVFETFLESAVRGKELGQFFTPREIVKFMTGLADLRIRKDNTSTEYLPDRVLDPCCGTGGFLIFALSHLFDQLEKLPISNRKSFKKRIKEEFLYGIDKSEDDIVPITRMNMYLHGDGGSHIYLADALDKNLVIEQGISIERSEELDELKTIIKTVKFGVILTNPPFSMQYSRDKPEEKRVLEQYSISKKKGTEGLKSSLKSNVMFLERNRDFLSDNGKLVTVIDESVLNTRNNADIRSFLRDSFVIRAAISLPMNSFVNQDAGVKTSILYLQKKTENDIQPKVFMALVENIGHSNSGKPELAKNQLGRLLEDYFEYEKTGSIPSESIAFDVVLSASKDIRLDCEFYNPKYAQLVRSLSRVSRDPEYRVESIEEICIKGGIFLGKNFDENKNEFKVGRDVAGCKYVKIEQMMDKYLDWNKCLNISLNFAEHNKGKLLKAGDVLTPSRGDTIGKIDIVDRDDVCAIAYGNIHILRCDQSRILPEYLVYYLRSDIGQLQFRHHRTGSWNPPQLIQEDLKRFLVFYPKDMTVQKKIIDEIRREERKAIKCEQKAQSHLANRKTIFEDKILAI